MALFNFMKKKDSDCSNILLNTPKNKLMQKKYGDSFSSFQIKYNAACKHNIPNSVLPLRCSSQNIMDTKRDN